MVLNIWLLIASLTGNGESWCGGEGVLDDEEDIIGASRGGEGHLDAHVVYGREGRRTRGGCRNCRASVGQGRREKRLEGFAYGILERDDHD